MEASCSLNSVFWNLDRGNDAVGFQVMLIESVNRQQSVYAFNRRVIYCRSSRLYAGACRNQQCCRDGDLQRGESFVGYNMIIFDSQVGAPKLSPSMGDAPLCFLPFLVSARAGRRRPKFSGHRRHPNSWAPFCYCRFLASFPPPKPPPYPGPFLLDTVVPGWLAIPISP